MGCTSTKNTKDGDNLPYGAREHVDISPPQPTSHDNNINELRQEALITTYTENPYELEHNVTSGQYRASHVTNNENTEPKALLGQTSEENYNPTSPVYVSPSQIRQNKINDTKRPLSENLKSQEKLDHQYNRSSNMYSNEVQYANDGNPSPHFSDPPSPGNDPAEYVVLKYQQKPKHHRSSANYSPPFVSDGKRFTDSKNTKNEPAHYQITDLDDDRHTQIYTLDNRHDIPSQNKSLLNYKHASESHKTTVNNKEVKQDFVTDKHIYVNSHELQSLNRQSKYHVNTTYDHKTTLNNQVHTTPDYRTPEVDTYERQPQSPHNRSRLTDMQSIGRNVISSTSAYTPRTSQTDSEQLSPNYAGVNQNSQIRTNNYPTQHHQSWQQQTIHNQNIPIKSDNKNQNIKTIHMQRENKMSNQHTTYRQHNQPQSQDYAMHSPNNADNIYYQNGNYQHSPSQQQWNQSSTKHMHEKAQYHQVYHGPGQTASHNPSKTYPIRGDHQHPQRQVNQQMHLNNPNYEMVEAKTFPKNGSYYSQTNDNPGGLNKQQHSKVTTVTKVVTTTSDHGHSHKKDPHNIQTYNMSPTHEFQHPETLRRTQLQNSLNNVLPLENQPVQMAIQSSSSSVYQYVAALDLGHSFSCFAFAACGNPSKIEVNKNWAAHLGYTSNKTPSAILVDDQKRFLSFGFQAYEDYSRMLDENENNLFQIKLYNNLKEKPKNKDQRWKVSTALWFLKTECTHAIESYSDVRGQNLKIKWSLPLPMDYMNEHDQRLFYNCLSQIGMSDDSVVLYSESDCALHYCLSLGHSVKAVERHQCVVITAGDSAVVATLYQYTNRTGWTYVYHTTARGGRDVTTKFINFIKVRLNEKFIENIQRELPAVWHTFVSSFDKAKRDISLKSKSGGIKIPLESIFVEFFAESTGKSLKSVMWSDPFISLNTKDGSFVIPSSTLPFIFSDILDDIERKLRAVLSKSSNADTVFLVGGFGDCTWVKDKISFLVGDRRLIIPEEPNLCIAKGAVLKGMSESSV